MSTTQPRAASYSRHLLSAFLIWLLIITGVPNFNAQTQIYQPPQSEMQSQHSTQLQSSPLSPESDYCTEPENATLPECANFRQGGQRQSLDGPAQGDLPSAMRNSIPYPTFDRNADSVQDSYPRQKSARSSTPEYRVTEPPTEFQLYVQSSVGRLLPIYGARLFDRVPSTFAPADLVPVTSDYIVGPGDEIDVQVWGQLNFRRRLTVDRAGAIFLSQVGSITVAGLRFSQLQDALRSAIGHIYRNFDINVNMGQLRSIQIFVVGQARRPGAYTVSSLSTLVNALFASGGPSSRGSLRDIQLKRAGTLITHFDLYDLLLHGDKSKDVRLLPGDVIFIPGIGPQIAISGSVESAAIYELKGGTTLAEALECAGGLSPISAAQRAILERVNQNAALETQNVQLTGRGLATPLQNGDIIRLLPVVPRFENAIVLRGNVADAGRFPWHTGMKISDLIPDKESLLTRDYWRERNKLETAGQADHPSGPDNAVAANPSGVPGESEVTTNAPVRGGMGFVGMQPTANVLATSRNYREETRDTTADRSLAAAVSGENALPVRQFIARNDVQAAAPDIDWDYAVIERPDQRNLTTHLVPFNLGKAVIDRDPAADLSLEPGDIVTIFSHADLSVPRAQQTKFVRLEGEIKMAGVYSVHPGETLHQVVIRAGGLTPNAYLFGAQFTRESTRREQQKRYNEFLDQLERDIDQNTANLTGRVVSVEQAATAQTSITGQRSMVERLRQIPASGRIVLDLEHDSSGVDALPDIPLDNGDRLYVPSVPQTVNVVGTVYNQSAFLYSEDSRLGDYLQEAGGPMRFADKSHLFVIRADGSVIAREGRPGLFTSKFDSLHIYPGDTLVVPTHVNRTTFLRGLLDWSQVLSNFGLGAAAINVLR
ncbi:MAG: SLBB domain-containing protein [Bryobacteraceae bacterium]